MKTNTNEEDFGMKSKSLFFTYARFKGENNFRLFGLFDNCTYFKKCCAPRYKLKDIEDHKRLAIKLVELNKDMDLQIKFVGMNNKILFNTLFLCKQ